MTGGRPLRFLRRVLGGWIALRLIIFGLPLLWWESGRAPAAYAVIEDVFPIREVIEPPLSFARLAGQRITAAWPDLTASIIGAAPLTRHGEAPYGHTPDASGGWGGADAMLAASLGFVHDDRPAAMLDFAGFAPGRASRTPTEVTAAQPFSAPAVDQRWRGTVWAFWRGESGGASAMSGSQLGGSQAGVRIDHAIGRIAGGATSAYARASAAMAPPYAAEAALGLAWRPARTLPVTLAVERRQRVSAGGRSAFAAYAAGGIDPTDIGAGLTLEGYGQAGIVGFADPDAFVDGKLSVTRRLTERGARRDIAIGASLSGGAQPGASRLDIGPEVQLRLPLGKERARLSAEWRERIAGDALPASGPTVTLIGEF